MLEGYEEFKALLDDKNIKMKNDKFNTTIQDFSFQWIFKDEDIEFKTLQKILEIKVIILKTCLDSDMKFIIVCFERNLIILNQTCSTIIKVIFSRSKEDSVYFFPNHRTNKSSYFESEIQNLMKSLDINNK